MIPISRGVVVANKIELWRCMLVRSRRVRNSALVLAVIVVWAAVWVPSADAQTFTFKVLYTFTGLGWGGTGTLFQDASGNLYGTTAFTGSETDGGTLFILDNDGKEKALHLFALVPGDGLDPYAGVIQDAAGNLYGTTSGGGTHNAGTVFVASDSGQERVLHSFSDSPDGYSPLGGLVQDARGNLYGTTTGGGAFGGGTVFVIDKAGEEKILYSFSGPDGATPYAGLMRDAAGNLYGTTYYGGAAGRGAVFVLSPTGKEKVLYSFTGANGDGENPRGGLIQDSAGNLYGTTYQGGAYNGGTVFVLTTSGREKVLRSFRGANEDGVYPYAGLVQDAAGNLYGTNFVGGVGSGNGTVFMVTRSGEERVLHTFTGAEDGGNPWGGLFRDAAGNLYGTTYDGADGGGTVFELSPSSK